jgi:hypothetical protein
LEGFRQDCIRANSARLRFVEWFKRADEENDGDVSEPGVALDALAQRVAVGAGHHHVREQDVGRRLLGERAQRRLAVADRDHLHPLVAEGEADDLLDRRRVVSEQEFPASRKQKSLLVLRGAGRSGGAS